MKLFIIIIITIIIDIIIRVSAAHKDPNDTHQFGS